MEEDDSPITDADECTDPVVGRAIKEFQEKSKELTDRMVALADARVDFQELLLKYRQAAILAYAAAQVGDLNQVKSQLQKVINDG